jgi:SOS-response transcriptional repressor LexA
MTDQRPTLPASPPVVGVAPDAGTPTLGAAPETATRDTTGDPRASPNAVAAALATGAHDEALVHLVAGATVPDLRSALVDPAWDDERLLAWWALEARERTARAARRTSDAQVLAHGRALQARALARRLGVGWRAGRPALVVPTVPGSPSQVLTTAALLRQTPVVDLPVAAGVGRELWDEDADAWLRLPDDVAPGRYLALRVAGDSMEPVMHTGDTVLVALGAPARVGEAIVARHPDDGYVCKRVRRVRAAALELESLAAGRPLITIPRDPALVVGRVVAVWCHHAQEALEAQEAQEASPDGTSRRPPLDGER